MTPLKEGRLRRAIRHADADPDLIQQLGIAVLVGMYAVEDAERFTGLDTVENTYRTHFPTPDGREWELTVKPRGDA